MSARPTLTNVALSLWSQPFAGLAPDNKTVSVQGPYNAVQTAAGVATSDAVSVSADYGVYDTTVNANLDANSTNFRDPF